MPDSTSFDKIVDSFRQTMLDCRNIYLQAGLHLSLRYPHLLPVDKDAFIDRMDDLHKGLLIKVYVCIAEADRKWVAEERRLGQELFLHAWGQWIEGPALRETAARVFEYAAGLRWLDLLGPFALYPPLREHVAGLETVFLRFANLVAKADGNADDRELVGLRALKAEFEHQLHGLRLDDVSEPGPPEFGSVETANKASLKSVGHLSRGHTVSQGLAPRPDNLAPKRSTTQEPTRLNDILRELDALIGLEAVKSEVKSLTNFLSLQRQRQAAGFPVAPLSLHMVFSGNPGTGKTTVARIVGQILGAMEILKRGHVVETDRSGLVAEFAGQTGPKTNRRIDDALDGVLFIDEAYSLVSSASDDPYGAEAVQTLLKRMEDDRDRLVVILAGYPEPTQRLLTSNPGLSSRFNRRLHFEDYQPVALAKIFAAICEKHHYLIPPEARGRLLLGFAWLFRNRDEHFGNGRLARNLFEDAIRALADRIVGLSPITHELLTQLAAEDLRFQDVPSEWLEQPLKDTRFDSVCPGCQRACHIQGNHLGRKVVCKHCKSRFSADWGVPKTH